MTESAKKAPTGEKTLAILKSIAAGRGREGHSKFVTAKLRAQGLIVYRVDRRAGRAFWEVTDLGRAVLGMAPSKPYTPPKMMPGQEPYTQEEFEQVRELVAAAAEAGVTEVDEVEGVV